jgi:hypothetical protein
MKLRFLWVLTLVFSMSFAQTTYWQQEVNYTMDFLLDVDENIYSGTQKVKYTNASPDVLNEIYFHAYFNAFQPNSMMDVRSRTIMDPDKRVGSRIVGLNDKEIGYTQISDVVRNGETLKTTTVGTLIKVETGEIQPGETIELEMKVQSQIPVQIRRSGRDNAQGIRYTMTQWYPKVAAYDVDGWHIDQYIGREFYGEWGSFDLCLTIDKSYILGGSGVLQNVMNLSNSYGYSTKGAEKKENSRYTTSDNLNTWHFVAENVHDFAFAADPDYTHKLVTLKNGQELHFFYQEKDNENKGWEKLFEDMPKVFNLAKKQFGDYPYAQYSFIQGGDGGMEYPMCTMVKGSSRGTAIHELMHSWYQGMLATNELWFEWMDEGFTTWSSVELEHSLGWQKDSPKYCDHHSSVRGYNYLVSIKKEEPICTHADMYETNVGYGVSAYSKGELFLENLSYIVGKEKVYEILREYHSEWAFKHPKPENFIRIAEKVSGMNLDHFFIDWTKTTKHIDYAVKSVSWNGNTTTIDIERVGEMAMPLEVTLNLKGGSKIMLYAPLTQMYGSKTDFRSKDVVNIGAIPWVNKSIELPLEDLPISKIESIEIFAGWDIPDTKQWNNLFELKGLNTSKEKGGYTLELKKTIKKVKEKNKKGKKVKKKKTFFEKTYKSL